MFWRIGLNMTCDFWKVMWGNGEGEAAGEWTQEKHDQAMATHGKDGALTLEAYLTIFHEIIDVTTEELPNLNNNTDPYPDPKSFLPKTIFPTHQSTQPEP